MVFTNSEFTKKLVLGYGVPFSKIELVYPGVESEYEKQAKAQSLCTSISLKGICPAFRRPARPEKRP